MKQFREIEHLAKGMGPYMVGDGFNVLRYFPKGHEDMNRLSPFLLLDYQAPEYYTPTDVRRGVGAHPHRGFETVTIAYSGKVEHHDNKGNYGIIGPGDVQWMSAASGVMHKEYHEGEFSKQGGILHMIQLWVNLPADKKMTEPKYQPLLKENMGRVELEHNAGEISIIAGEVQGVKGPASTFTPINLYNVSLKNHGKVVVDEPGSFNTSILVLQGEVKINEKRLCKENDLVLFENMEGSILVEAVTEDALFIVLSGELIDEKVVSHGPFVMNTEEEIYQAYKDFRENKFGIENF